MASEILDQPAAERQPVDDYIINSEEINTIRRGLEWVIGNLTKQIGYQKCPLPYKTLVKVPTKGEVPLLLEVQQELTQFLNALPEIGKECRRDELKSYYKLALATMSSECGHITHNYWQILSWYDHYAVIRGE